MLTATELLMFIIYLHLPLVVVTVITTGVQNSVYVAYYALAYSYFVYNHLFKFFITSLDPQVRNCMY